MLEGIIEACPGGSGTTYKIVQGGGAKQKLVQGAFTSLSLGGGRGIIQACPGVFLSIVPGVYVCNYCHL